MKKLVTFLVVMMTAVFAVNAQNANPSSTISFTGLVSSAVDIRIASVTGKSTGVINGTVTPTAVMINLGDLSPNRNPANATNGHAAFTVNVQLRSNDAYTLNGQAGGLSGGGDDSSLQLIDVGLGIPSVTATGSNALAAAVTSANSDIAANGLSNDPAGSGLVNGYPNYSKTLNDFASTAELFNGSRISNEGNTNSSNNALNVPLRFAAAPQFYDPTVTFNGTMTVSITTP